MFNKFTVLARNNPIIWLQGTHYPLKEKLSYLAEVENVIFDNKVFSKLLLKIGLWRYFLKDQVQM